MSHANGTFKVELAPQGTEDTSDGAKLGRMSIDKQFSGDLDATSRGEMLTAVSKVDGSAGYVAIEKVTGKLAGRSGSFVLQHSGVMTRGAPQATILVVPDSGTGELEGLTGSMKILIEDGQHRDEFEYRL